jgi:nucleotidyltransferase AbiEii toxin of type IV toxin-antitoxin system
MAGAMRLYEHDDFAALITAAAEEEALQEAFVEKDYWITEILHVIAQTLPDRTIFKGGTSLSKGWGLLDRFSEDIDLFVNPGVEPALSRRGTDRVLKQLKEDVAAVPGLEFVESKSRKIKGLGRQDLFRYDSRFAAVEEFPPTVRLEPGVQSGERPTEVVQISSIVGSVLARQGVVGELGVEGLSPFAMTLLHFRRTFVEKLFAIHGKVERLAREGFPLGRDVRHYADLYVLAGKSEVREMLASDEYESIRLDYDEKSRAFFARSYRPPAELRFAASDALFPSDELRMQIEPGYEQECRRLFFRPYPSFAEVLGRFAEIRDLL